MDVNLLELNFVNLFSLFLIPLLTVSNFYYLGVYRSMLRFIDFSDVFLLLKAIALSCSIALIIMFALVSLEWTLFVPDPTVSLSLKTLQIWIVCVLLNVVFLVGSRISANYLLADQDSETRVIIYGAGSAGMQLASALRVSKEFQPIAFIDNNKAIQKNVVGGIKVFHPEQLRQLIKKENADEVLIAMPSASKLTLRTLLKEIEKYSIKVRILPGFAELAQGKILVSELKEIVISDLLGRLEVEANTVLLNKNINDKSVMITGAGGSIGSEIAKQVAGLGPNKIILLDSNEFALYSIKKDIESLNSSIDIYSILANVTNKKKISDICLTFKVDTIYHTAAYKHVPMVEENAFEGVKNNIFGTRACVEAAIENKVETFVLISTDKAVRPTNIMGATKRFSEMILQSLASRNSPDCITRMIMVRFGNVLGSSGSAIPLFQKQIKDGGPVTVTDPEVVRYFMSIPEAAELVIQAGAMGLGGDVFVLDMGEPVKILDLVKRLISLSGMEHKDKDHPGGDIEIIFTGLRPGEKLYEELLIGNNVSATLHKQIFRAEEEFKTNKELEEFMLQLKEAEKNNDVIALKKILKEAIQEFVPANEVVDVINLQRNLISGA
jgi:FlaA1/EpsC-like NDP-sugar epimerase